MATNKKKSFSLLENDTLNIIYVENSETSLFFDPKKLAAWMILTLRICESMTPRSSFIKKL